MGDEPAERLGGWRSIEDQNEKPPEVEPGPNGAVLLAWEYRDGTRQSGEAYWHPDDPHGGAWWWAGTSPGDYHTDCIVEILGGRIIAWQPLPPPPRDGPAAGESFRKEPLPSREQLERAIRKACDLLAERVYGSAARSPGHNARLILERALAGGDHG